LDQNETKNYRICIYPSLIEKNLDQWNNLRQETKYINKYRTQFNDYMMRCAIRENEPMTLRRFYKGLNDDFRKKVKLISALLLTKPIL
jgi:predicted N-acyltransferase